MNQTKKNKIILFLLIIIILFGGGYLLWNIQNKSNNSAQEEPSNTEQISKESKNTYTDEKYGFRFVYPQGWRIGDNRIDYGTLQLFNYSAAQASGKGGFPGDGGMNKIEAAISANNAYGSSDDYPEKSRTTAEVTVAGQKATRTEVELAGGEKMIFYAVPLPKHPGKFFGVTIYGDPSNFHVLDEIIASIEWLQ